MATKLYQVTLDQNGVAVSALQLPDEPAKNRVVFVRAESEHKAKRTGESLFSLAK